MKEGNKLNLFDDNFLSPRQVILLIGIVIVILIAAYLKYVYFNPTNVFKRMINNTLQTSSYTKTISTIANYQKSQQIVTVETGSTNRVLDSQTLSLPYSNKSAISILSIGTPSTDYSKYTRINTGAKNSSGHVINFTPAVGLWGANVVGIGSTSNGVLFNNSVLDIVPIANVSEEQKQILTKYLNSNKVYDFSNKVKSQSINGRPKLTYDVKINLTNLTSYLHLFAKAVGIKLPSDKSEVANIPTTGTAELQFVVDQISSQLYAIKFPNTPESYIYSSFGVQPRIDTPKKFISLNKLEQYIQSLSTK